MQLLYDHHVIGYAWSITQYYSTVQQNYALNSLAMILCANSTIKTYSTASYRSIWIGLKNFLCWQLSTSHGKQAISKLKVPIFHFFLRQRVSAHNFNTNLVHAVNLFLCPVMILLNCTTAQVCQVCKAGNKTFRKA
jgi:hypothetical protein